MCRSYNLSSQPNNPVCVIMFCNLSKQIKSTFFSCNVIFWRWIPLWIIKLHKMVLWVSLYVNLCFISFLFFLQLLYRCRRFPLPLSTTWPVQPSPRATTWSATPRAPRGIGHGVHITKSRATLNLITLCKLPMEMYSCQIVSHRRSVYCAVLC